MEKLKLISTNLITTLIIGLTEVSLAILILNSANNDHETIVYAILVIIYSAVQINGLNAVMRHSQIHSWITSIKNVIDSLVINLLKGKPNDLSVLDSNDTGLSDAIVSAIDNLFTLLLEIISLFYIVRALL